MRKARSFLVVAEDPERLFLISHTLHRKFPNSVVHTCRDSDAAMQVAQTQKLDAIVSHRSTDSDEIPLIQHLRSATKAPIIGMSAYHDAAQAIAAGASKYLHTEQWLLVGPVVADAIGAEP